MMSRCFCFANKTRVGQEPDLTGSDPVRTGPDRRVAHRYPGTQSDPSVPLVWLHNHSESKCIIPNDKFNRDNVLYKYNYSTNTKSRYNEFMKVMIWFAQLSKASWPTAITFIFHIQVKVSNWSPTASILFHQKFQEIALILTLCRSLNKCTNGKIFKNF